MCTGHSCDGHEYRHGSQCMAARLLECSDHIVPSSSPRMLDALSKSYLHFQATPKRRILALRAKRHRHVVSNSRPWSSSIKPAGTFTAGQHRSHVGARPKHRPSLPPRYRAFGLVAAGLLVMSGLGPEKAIEVVSAARGPVIPETPEQVEWINHLPSEKLVPAR